MTPRGGFAIAGVSLFLWLAVLGIQISAAGIETTSRRADVAIILGAAVRNNRPTPVFEERIRHGVALYHAGRVRRLLMTGGYSDGEDAEANVARRRAIELGVPSAAILVETRSHTTFQNLAEAGRLMRVGRTRTALIVSDPLHMKRAVRMAEGLGIDASGSPTLTTRYRGAFAKAGFLLRELLFYNFYLVTGR